MKKLLVLLMLLVSSMASATDWYVDSSNDGGTENGTSWATAWGKFADINWGSIGSGDTIYISGGTVSKTYTAQLVIGNSNVTIKPGQAAPHNGTVIISPATVGHDSIYWSSKSNVTISGSGGIGTYGFKLDNPNGFGIRFGGSWDGILIEYVEMANNGYNEDSGDCIRTVFPSVGLTHGSFEIRYNYCHDSYQDGFGFSAINLITPVSPAILQTTPETQYGLRSIHHNIITNIHDDHIESFIGSIDIYNNTFSNRINPSRGHPDGHQLYNSYYRIYNNSYSGFMNAAGGNSIVYWEPDGGFGAEGWWNLSGRAPSHFKLYNNTFHEDNTASTSMTGIHLGLSDAYWTSISDFYVANNTFIGGVYGGSFLAGWGEGAGITTLCKNNITNFYVVNNVFENSSINSIAWSLGTDGCTGTPMDYGSFGDGTSWVIDYNVYTGTGGGYVTGTPYATWKSSTGAQDHGITSSSLIQTATFIPPSNSPVISAGIDLTSLIGFTTDKAGVSRGATWEIGAYEYGGASDTTPSAFSFTDNTGVARSTIIYSNPITVAGIDAASAISISGTGCQYKINSGSCNSTSSNVVLNDVVRLCGTSSASPATVYPSCTLTIGGIIDSDAPWTVTTSFAPILLTPTDNSVAGWPVSFTWNAVTGAYRYEIMVDNNSDWSSPEIDDATVDPATACSPTVCTYNVQAGGALQGGVHYYWRVRALK